MHTLSASLGTLSSCVSFTQYIHWSVPIHHSHTQSKITEKFLTPFSLWKILNPPSLSSERAPPFFSPFLAALHGSLPGFWRQLYCTLPGSGGNSIAHYRILAAVLYDALPLQDRSHPALPLPWEAAPPVELTCPLQILLPFPPCGRFLFLPSPRCSLALPLGWASPFPQTGRKRAWGQQTPDQESLFCCAATPRTPCFLNPGEQRRVPGQCTTLWSLICPYGFPLLRPVRKHRSKKNLRLLASERERFNFCMQRYFGV